MPPPSLFAARILVASVLLLAACGEAPDGMVANLPDSPPPQPSGEWVTLLERERERRSSRPEPFTSTSTRLRVITTMGPNQTEYDAGFVVTNLLSDETTLPVASVRAQQIRLDSASVDTTEVNVPTTGKLYFFVAEHRRLADWRVSIQEFRPAAEPATSGKTAS